MSSEIKDVTETLRTVVDLARPFLEPVAAEAGEFIADRIRHARVVGAVRMLQRTREILEQHGLKIGPVSLKIAYPILEGASVEDEDELMESWARLLASASTGLQVTPAFTSILGQLRAVEAKILEVLWEQACGREPPGWADVLDQGVSGQEIRERIGLERPDMALSFDNLFRLNLMLKTRTLVGSGAEQAYDHDGYSLTVLGWSFMRSCTGPHPQALREPAK